jgi:predicted TIM-barrel fold metal-dependent hydrolase
MIDNHVHIGQFDEAYYEPVEIINIAMETGIDGLVFSSTSSCINDVQYIKIEQEINNLFALIPYSPDTVKPYFWFIPDYIRQGISIEATMRNLPYKGIKIHPLTHQWDFKNKVHLKALHTLFSFADNYNLPVLIHTGHNKEDGSDRFSLFFSEYPDVNFTLAHCRPLDKTIKMLAKYPNVYCDTAFAEFKEIKEIVSKGFASRVLLGSDFPITHFFTNKYPRNGQRGCVSLREQYQRDIKLMQAIEEQIGIKEI